MSPRPGVDLVGGSGLSVFDLTALAALDATGLAQGTTVYVSSFGYSYYLRGVQAPMMPGAVPVLGMAGATWVPMVSSPIVGAGGQFIAGGVAVSGLNEWKRADLNRITRAGTWPTVASWLDASGVGAAGSRDETATGTPQWLANAINGRPGIVTANGSYFSNTITNLHGDRAPRTVFIVCKSNNATGGRLRNFRVAGQQYMCSFINSGGFIIYSDAVAVTGRIVDTPSISGVPMILEYSFDGNTAAAAAAVPRLRINGVDHGVVSGTMGVETGTTGFATGTDIASQTLNWVGPICEVIDFTRTLAPFEKFAITNAYLAPWYSVPCPLTTQVMALGDSTTAGAGDALTTAAGGWRRSVSDRHPKLQFIGGLYGPLSVLAETDNGGVWKRSEGHTGFTSGPIVPPGAGQGIGGPQLAGYLGVLGTVPDLIMLQIGQNDAGLGTYTAAQTASNISDILDLIYVMAPACKVLVMRANRMRSNNAAANAVILAQGTTVANAIAGKPNVLGGLLFPPDQPDANYVDDNHQNSIGYAGNADVWDAALSAFGY